MDFSFPTHLRLSSHVGPDPSPWDFAQQKTLWAPENPSIRQKTLASLISKSSSQTVPHEPRAKTSMRPTLELEPFARRTLVTDRGEC